MECYCGKQPSSPGGAVEMTERRGAAESRTEEITDADVHLQHPENPDEVVHFGMRLDDGDGQLVLSETVDNSLGRNAGICHGDVLVHINGTNIEGWQVQDLLDLLREKVKPKLLLTIKRQLDEGTHKFVWTYFKLVKDQDNKPRVKILYLTQTDTDEMPWIILAASEPFEYEWLGPPVAGYDITSSQNNDTTYLSIEKGDVKFVPTYNGDTSQFYRYIYVGPGEPGNGIPVIYSLQQDEKPLTESTTHETVKSLDADPTLGVTDFPKPIQKELVRLNPRFWYQKVNLNGEYSFQSIEHTGWYLNNSKGTGTVSKTAEFFKIAASE